MKRSKTRLKKALLTYYPKVFEALESRDVHTLTLLSNQVCHDAELGTYAYDESKYPAVPSGDEIGADDLALIRGFLEADDKASFLREAAPAKNTGLVWFLYAAVWHAGEVRKLRHLLSGVRDYVDGNEYREDGTMKAWYALGRHVASGGTEPLVNKQVTRAHKVYLAGYDFSGADLKSPEPEDHLRYHRWMKERGFPPRELHLAHKALFTIGNATKVLL
jgi:hypothetical protein